MLILPALNLVRMFTLFKKEINGFLNSLIGYIVMIVFLLMTGLFLWVFPLEYNILDFGFAGLDGLFILAPFVFLFLIPAITMRSFADEKKSGTLELLMTQPLTDLQVILAKYFAGVVLVVISLLPTLVYYGSVYMLGLPPGILTREVSGDHTSACSSLAPVLSPSAFSRRHSPITRSSLSYSRYSSVSSFIWGLNLFTTSSFPGKQG